MVKHDFPQQQSTDQQSAIRKGGGLLQRQPKSPELTNGYAVLENVNKASLERVEVGMLPKQKPDFDLPGATKDGLIAAWLKDWINQGISHGKLNETHLLPKKADIAKYLSVSVGTVQNAIRFIEDEGFVESKQRIGTIIRDPERENSRLRKLTSKRDHAVIAVKRLILDRTIQPGEALPSAREIARIIGSAPNTTRLALEFLSSADIVENRGARGNKANWFLHAVPVMSDTDTVKAIESDTLIDQIERDLKALISAQFAVGDKLPSHLELAETLKVSIKTVHDAMCRITEQGIVHSKRGRVRNVYSASARHRQALLETRGRFYLYAGSGSAVLQLRKSRKAPEVADCQKVFRHRETSGNESAGRSSGCQQQHHPQGACKIWPNKSTFASSAVDTAARL